MILFLSILLYNFNVNKLYITEYLIAIFLRIYSNTSKKFNGTGLYSPNELHRMFPSIFRNGFGRFSRCYWRCTVIFEQ